MTQKNLEPQHKQELEKLFADMGYKNYHWIDPKQIVVAQWVRMKCIYGCPEYGQNACCPPNVPSVPECERFFREYSEGVIFHFAKKVENPEDRHVWSKYVNAKLAKLERGVFLAGFERAFVLFMDSCTICDNCHDQRTDCENPQIARPTPEALAVDVFSTVHQAGFHLEVKTDYNQEMDRYAFLMIR